MPRRPWTTTDRFAARTKLAAVVALATTAAAISGTVWSDDSSDSSRSYSSSSSSDSGWSQDEEEAQFGWRQILSAAQGALLSSAEAPYRRPGIRFAIGPERYSFDRIQQQWGNSTSCKAAFRFELSGLRLLRVVLAFPPSGFCIRNRRNKVLVSTTGEEALLVLLRRLSYPHNYSDLAWEAGRSPTQLCQIVQWSISHVYYSFPHLRDSRSLECWTPHMRRFAAAVHRGGKNRRGIRRPCPLKNCFMFVDGSNQRTTRPGIYQQYFFNGHKRCHCVKWQGLMLPNGIMPYPFGPINGHRHDSHMLKRSYLVRILRRMSRTAGQAYCVYGDPAYPQSDWVCGPYRDLILDREETKFNLAMSRCRIPNEWGFGKIRSNWAYLDFAKKNQPYLNDLSRIWPVAQILTNCHTCLYGSQTGWYFQVRPPSLHQYVSMGRDLPVRGY